MTIRRYGQWAGNPRGMAEDKTLCIVEVAEAGRSVLFRQCQRKRGYGPDGAYCPIHAKRLGEKDRRTGYDTERLLNA